MTIAFATVHRTLTYRGEDTGLHVLAFDDGTMFLSRRTPPLYDAKARRIRPREVIPGSRVNVRYQERQGQKWMDAVQLVHLPDEEQAPFNPILDDGHL